MDWTPVYQCPACLRPMDIFPCTSCGRKLTKEEEAVRDKLVEAAGGRNTLEYVRIQGALNETIEQSRYKCPECGRKGDSYPCPGCGHKLTEKQENDLRISKEWIEASKKNKYVYGLKWESQQMGKLLGEYDSDGEVINKPSGGCIVVVLSLCGFFFSALLCWLIAF